MPIIRVVRTARVVQLKKQGFGKRIADARKAAGYSQKALMEKLGWPNDSNARLSGYENEEREPTIADFAAIAKHCRVDPAFLAFGEYRLDPELSQIVQNFPVAESAIKDMIRAGLRITARSSEKRAAE